MALLSLVATPLLAFGGALLGLWLNRRSATELDRWRKREETMRMLRWATEVALADDARRAESGAAILTALLVSPLVDPVDVELPTSVAATVATSMSGPGPPGVGSW
jgi:hypothetical protein